MGVMRLSSDDVISGPQRSASEYIVRNFQTRNIWSPRPTRTCL